MKNRVTGDLKQFDKLIKEISLFLKAISCNLKRKSKNKFQVMHGTESTGLVIVLESEINEEKFPQYILAYTTFPIPANDVRFFRSQNHVEKDSYPCVRAKISDKTEKTLIFEFIARSIYYFGSTKTLRKWHCANCGEIGYEVFLDNGMLYTFDADCNEFYLVIVDKDREVQGIVFDDKIDEYVWPLCADCSDNEGYENDYAGNLTVDRVYFDRLLSVQSENMLVMKACS